MPSMLDDTLDAQAHSFVAVLRYAFDLGRPMQNSHNLLPSMKYQWLWRVRQATKLLWHSNLVYDLRMTTDALTHVQQTALHAA